MWNIRKIWNSISIRRTNCGFSYGAVVVELGVEIEAAAMLFSMACAKESL